MSAMTAAGATALRLVPGHWREASLRLVPTPGRRAPRAAFVAVVMGVLALGLVGLLVMTTGMQQRAFTLFELENEIAGLRAPRAPRAGRAGPGRGPERGRPRCPADPVSCPRDWRVACWVTRVILAG